MARSQSGAGGGINLWAITWTALPPSRLANNVVVTEDELNRPGFIGGSVA
jgi:hypothetical protein